MKSTACLNQACILYTSYLYICMFLILGNKLYENPLANRKGEYVLCKVATDSSFSLWSNTSEVMGSLCSKNPDTLLLQFLREGGPWLCPTVLSTCGSSLPQPQGQTPPPSLRGGRHRQPAPAENEETDPNDKAFGIISAGSCNQGGSRTDPDNLRFTAQGPFSRGQLFGRKTHN